jgi:hypothetical protein
MWRYLAYYWQEMADKRVINVRILGLFVNLYEITEPLFGLNILFDDHFFEDFSHKCSLVCHTVGTEGTLYEEF